MADILTPQQQRVLTLLAEGLTADQIGPRIHLSPSTVKRHIKGIRARLNAANSAAAVDRGHRLGLLDKVGPVPMTAAQKLALINRWVTEPEVARLVAAERRAS